MIEKMAGALRVTDCTLNRTDPDGLRHVAIVSMRVHWFIAAVVFLEVMYRPYYEAGTVLFRRSQLPIGVQTTDATGAASLTRRERENTHFFRPGHVLCPDSRAK